ncbi:hypothetical protein KKE19_03170 [Patescibacteria group bacterium]|nr:hypothetical protein [Patescibacteria group bacterium]MBU4367791.1 hypothetical protein [Patescibacteria group bacterium]MBU4461481.1 hypothetical protein [Patescibacteria group bacterium]MCG2700387.1 hypothetical protein [Candidatus Parcubacteria bacterium]
MIKDIFKEVATKIVNIIKGNIVLTVIIAVVVVGVVGASIYTFYFNNGNKIGGNILTAQAAGQKAIDYINDNILQDQGQVSLKETQEVSGLYKIKIIFEGQDQDTDAYITKDGRYLFPVMQGLPIDLDQNPNNPATDGNSNTSEVTSCEDMNKSDKPVLEAFVVSQCPYGLQMQRVLAKVIEEAGALASNIKVRYIGSVSNGKITAMHGDIEAQENLKQICIREEQANKYWDYISCYMQAGETDKCLTSAGVNKTALDACVSDSNKGLVYAQEDFTLANQYSIGGSPTLLLGNDIISEFSFGGRTADALKTIICCASNNEPSLCSQELSTESAAAGLSQSYASGSTSNSTGGCE